MRKIFIAALFLALPSMVSANTDTQALRQTLFNLVNNERASANLAALRTNSLLIEAAQKKASDMMALQYFEHQSPTGKEFYQWIDETGYHYSFAGENLAANSYTISAQMMVESWMASPTHRANVLSDNYTETGMAVVSGTFQGKPTVFAVQVFAHPKQVPVAVPSAPVQTITPPVAAVPVKVAVPVVENPKPKIIKTETKPKETIAKAASSTEEEVLVLAVSSESESISQRDSAPKSVLAGLLQKLREFFKKLSLL